MAGVTATIDVVAFRADWASHMPIAALCDRYGITKDQVIRLRTVWKLPLRSDRRFRFKPKQQRDPTPLEIEQAKLEIQAKWDDATREHRRVCKSQPVQLTPIEMTPELQRYLEGLDNADA